MVIALCPSHPFLCGLYLNPVVYSVALKLRFFHKVPRIAPIVPGHSFEWRRKKSRRLPLCSPTGGHWTLPPNRTFWTMEWVLPSSANLSSSSLQFLVSLGPLLVLSFSSNVSSAPNNPWPIAGRRPCIFPALTCLVRTWNSIGSAAMGAKSLR